jgi:serine/threonine protein kinase
MPLVPGTRLGGYEILGLIGLGGMGEVYRARDSRLNRDVAIKVLPADVTADHDRLARFEREAQVLASLNHPNIAQIHGVEDSSGTPALVMELVEGPTLADRIAKGQFRSMRRCRLQSRSLRRWKPRRSRASFTEI